MASLTRILLLAPTARLKASGIPLSLVEVSKRLHVYLPEAELLNDAITSLVQSNDVRVVNATNYLARFQRECPSTVCVLAGDQELVLQHLMASVSIPCHTLALSPLVRHENQLPILKEALRQAELREVYVRDWMVQRFLPANMFVRDVIHDIDTFGPLLRGTEELPAVDLDWTTNLRSERTAVPPEQGTGLLNGLPVLLDLVNWLFFAGTSLNTDTDASVLLARQWPLPVPEATLCDVLKQSELPAAWQALVHQGIVLDPANGTSTVMLKDIHFGLTVQGDYDCWPTTDASHRLDFTVRGLNTTVESRVGRAADGSPQQRVNLRGADITQQKRLQRTAELWCRRYRSACAQLVSSETELTMTFPNGATELERASREAMEQFLRYCRYPQHAELSELDNQYAKAAITLRAVALATASTV